MPVTRTLRCTDCNGEFEHFYLHREDADPDCPYCTGAAARMPSRVNIGTNKGRAIDMVQKVAEADYGFTDLQDNLREGDVAAPKVQPMQTAEREAITQQMREISEQAHAPPSPEAGAMSVNSFWNAASGSPLVSQTGGALAGSTEARALGVDAVSLVEKAKAGDQGRMKFQVLAKGNG